MCRSTDYHGVHFNYRDRLKILSFFVRFSGLRSRKPLPESLTLLYLPRINENALEVDGSKIRPDSQAFVSLYRSVNAETNGVEEVVFGSRERVRASEGIRFEVYFKEEKVLKGIFRKDEDGEWKLDCKCALESDMVGGMRVSEAEVCVEVEGDVAMRENVAMVVKRKRNGRRGFSGLEEIPEEREIGYDDDDDESDGCDCSYGCGETEIGFDGGDLHKSGSDGELVELEMDMEGVRWAVDVGIWVMCLGVGFLVSKASAKTLRRKRLL
ncbi:uncharacterized protein LOC107430055 [Ziziphus jujuba]|uniref:Uncharacterized protein LOC107430055 n=1 Tax=Ziziphus jujuba TaxID=326968 RepID=A0A6P4AM87_ZIZJJ|nr:uncharacterized protein LOC107430055 [Ziziphus jujuba]